MHNPGQCLAAVGRVVRNQRKALSHYVLPSKRPACSCRLCGTRSTRLLVHVLSASAQNRAVRSGPVYIGQDLGGSKGCVARYKTICLSLQTGEIGLDVDVVQANWPNLQAIPSSTPSDFTCKSTNNSSRESGATTTMRWDK